MLPRRAHRLLDFFGGLGDGGGEVLVAVLRNEDVVLDADAEVAVGEVDAGLDGDDHAGTQGAVGGYVVDFESELMSDAVDEGVGIAGLVDHVSGGGGHVGNSGAGPRRLDGGQLR